MADHVVIYIPGLGDKRVTGQTKAVSLWRWYGVRGELFQMFWADQRDFAAKRELLLARIDSLLEAGHTVSLAAASAGASAALNIYAARKDQITGVYLICGKIHNAHRMHPSVVRRNRSFGQALEALPAALNSLTPADRNRILSVHPLADESVPVRDTRIPGSHERTLPTLGHFFGIAFGLTFYAPIALAFLKHQARQRSAAMLSHE